VRTAVAIGLTIIFMGVLPAPAKAAGEQRLPKGYHWGRCLLVVDGKTQISGKCAYEFRGDGGFYIAGPRQVFEGIDFHNPDGSGAGDQSRDYWASIVKDSDGTWAGYGNSKVDYTHGDQTYGTLTRRGACFVGAIDLGETVGSERFRGGAVRVCLWRK
jgi:hypothetical protein